MCQNYVMNLVCPSGKLISIERAVYGHYDPSVCPAVMHVSSNCHQNGDYAIVRDRCAEREACAVDVNGATFGGDPCPGTIKYLDVDYTCVSSKF